MPVLKWNENLSVGIEEIDNQHKLLIGYINELQQGLQNHEDRENLGKIIKKLAVYATIHFAKEEELFDRYSYYDSKKHKKAHLKFELKISEFEDHFQRQKANLSIEIIDFLSDWLKSHILLSDKKYCRFILESGPE